MAAQNPLKLNKQPKPAPGAEAPRSGHTAVGRRLHRLPSRASLLLFALSASSLRAQLPAAGAGAPATDARAPAATPSPAAAAEQPSMDCARVATSALGGSACALAEGVPPSNGRVLVVAAPLESERPL